MKQKKQSDLISPLTCDTLNYDKNKEKTQHKSV